MPASARLVDPEDDLTPIGYSGDFHPSTGTTTVIPPLDPSLANVMGYELFDGQEPLPYVQPHMPPQVVARAMPVAPVEIGPDPGVYPYVADRRGTQNLGLLVLRIALGAVLIAHAMQKLFGWWGGPGLTGFKDALASAGYRHADIVAYVSAGGGLVAGLLVLVGLFTPVAAAAALACEINGLLAAVSARPHAHTLSYFLPDGHEYQLTVIFLAVAVILCGPGRYALDGGRGWAYRPFIGSAVALVAGIGAGIATWALLNGVNPLT